MERGRVYTTCPLKQPHHRITRNPQLPSNLLPRPPLRRPSEVDHRLGIYGQPRAAGFTFLWCLVRHVLNHISNIATATPINAAHTHDLRFIVLDISHHSQPLSDLAQREFILISRPETSTASSVGVVADPMSREMPDHERIGNLRLERLQVQRAILVVDAGCTGLALDFKHGLPPTQPRK